MEVTIESALAEHSPIGVPRATLEELDGAVRSAADRIATGREQDEHGYAALNLPEETDPEPIEAAVESVTPAENWLTIGIGGSALGAATITEALDGDGETYYLDNVDPADIAALLADIDLSETAMNVVSRSGTTAETLANFLVVRGAMEAAGVDWTERTVITTGESGPLATLADRHDLPTLTVPDGVPGRFSALSAVGLAAAAFQGLDLEAILAGGRRAEASLADSLFESPAYAYGATMYALEAQGANVAAMMPYAESLEAFAEWFAQLWAESLGKDGRGQTPARALGATDQHSQLQLYRAGPKDKVVTLVRPRERPSVPIPETSQEAIDYLGGSDLRALIDAEFDATEASLRKAGVPAIRIEIDALDATGIGELLYTMEAACIMAGELAGVDTFTQPAVEWGKDTARALLRGEQSLETMDGLSVRSGPESQ
ncbi:glucose-6-phosphate isomerase [Halodesulfurarchaeum sp. HSR-GB]|uniref:glucose-6-phosphate isomerase n=1 Tax=Halodesulfurarchaeum sp. HSR-GB TaxID=3074077 RepID=UPI00286093A6|nr:glucose-6-phosphate isomerase [Halodesulfurarchaeum sp. HSR-GB]MDR5656017.1 glucose-6-phosphate isomerase [Halodesulfurarchaeum sp. HSR-GB]